MSIPKTITNQHKLPRRKNPELTVPRRTMKCCVFPFAKDYVHRPTPPRRPSSCEPRKKQTSWFRTEWTNFERVLHWIHNESGEAYFTWIFTFPVNVLENRVQIPVLVSTNGEFIRSFVLSFEMWIMWKKIYLRWEFDITSKNVYGRRRWLVEDWNWKK